MDSLLRQWQAAGREFRDEGRSIFYRDEGAGPVLLCMHGYPTASWDWHRVWPRLVQRYRLIAVDMLGFGFSDKPRDISYTIAAQATLHEQLLASLGIVDVHVLAHDYGDTVSQELMARQLERIQHGGSGLRLRTVSLLNGGLFPESHRARPSRRCCAHHWGRCWCACSTSARSAAVSARSSALTRSLMTMSSRVAGP